MDKASYRHDDPHPWSYLTMKKQMDQEQKTFLKKLAVAYEIVIKPSEWAECIQREQII